MQKVYIVIYQYKNNVKNTGAIRQSGCAGAEPCAAHSSLFREQGIDMKIKTIVNLSEAQKARIVSRKEQLPQRICTFELSPEKAEIISRLKGTYTVTGADADVLITATYSSENIQIDETYGYNQNQDWKVVQERIMLKDVLAEAYATGTIAEGANIDFALDLMQEAYSHRETIEKNNDAVRAERERKEEQERPAKEAREKAEKEAKAERDRIESQEAEKKKAEEKIRNDAIEAEKAAWIQQNGSERLKKGYEMGYNCQKLYATERAQSILGDGYQRKHEDADERDRSCPTLEALEEVERLKGIITKEAEIVWLPHGIDGQDESGSEAVKADPGNYTQHYFYKVL
jgi:hypothetical protein